MPERIQRKRTKGWRKPEGAVYVGRGSAWGNPYRVVPQTKNGPFDVYNDEWCCGQTTGMESARRMAVRKYTAARENHHHNMPDTATIREQLAGKDLMCWCPLDQPCHADVLLEIANGADHAA